MRLLLIHSDYIEYEAQKETPVAESGAVLKDALEEALVVFCAVEESDTQDLDDVIRQAADEIAASAQRVNAKSIMELLLLAAAFGTRLTIVAEGPDAQDAVEALAQLVASKFGEE